MPLSRRAQKKISDFNLGLSYRAQDTKPNLRDALNVYTNQGRLDTRHGYSRLNSTSLGGKVLSCTHYGKADGTIYNIVKVGTELISVSFTGAHTTIKTGLTATTKHRAITFNDRHIIAIEEDGLFSWDGTSFNPLGESAPVGGSTGASEYTLSGTGSGSSLPDATYGIKATYYSTTLGVETEASEARSQAISGTAYLRVTNAGLDTGVGNSLFDKVRFYLADETAAGDYLFSFEADIDFTTGDIGAVSTSQTEPPTDCSAPLAGGGKFFTEFNRRVVYAGSNSFKNDVFFSSIEAPDCYDFTLAGNKTINIPGSGKVTGISTGLYNGNALDPYLVIFKKRSTHIYSEIGGNSKFVTIDNQIGCVSHDTITVKNGAIYFLSERGWRAVFNGNMVKDPSGDATTLSRGDIDDIFTYKGFGYEINKAQLENCFSAYYPTLDQYITWVAEGVNPVFSKQYVYEYDLNKFKAYTFSINATCAMSGEDQDGNQAVVFGDDAGYLYTHSVEELKTDIDSSETDVNIPAFALIWWIPESGDYDATYNFRELIVRAFTNSDLITVKAWQGFNQTDTYNYSLDFSQAFGFVLDESLLDEGILTDERQIITARADINLVSESLLIGFYQEAADASLGLLSLQLDLSKNGNRN